MADPKGTKLAASSHRLTIMDKGPPHAFDSLIGTGWEIRGPECASAESESPRGRITRVARRRGWIENLCFSSDDVPGISYSNDDY